jgi:putative tryptophan/tyrosine transport system substrate-binding protein
MVIGIGRRKFITAIGGAAVAWPLAVRAQQSTMPVIGYLSSQSAATGTDTPSAHGFHQGLRDAGYTEGQNVTIEYRWADEHRDRLPMLAADLVARRVTVIFTIGGPAPTLAAKAATSTIPIVFFNGSDPVKSGFVESLNRPGGNVTGVSLYAAELGQKRLEMLSELIPAGTEIGMLVNPDDADSVSDLEQVRIAIGSIGRSLNVVHATLEGEFEAAFATLRQQHVAALIVSTGTLFGNRARQIIALAAQYALPAIYDRSLLPALGGLMSYGPRFDEVGRRAGIYVSKCLKGEKPADLPVELPTTFELVINLKTAKTLGLTVPQNLLVAADRVIE